ncbi:MAG TPA: multifunctional transcriptional regulator/nicotinamide-nucleotide adenylyltransferase/ribosylnicotinamide kinase NadR [Candidatus Dojkabacteria bacterium]|nr:multifunctional transcriptional regulator/nicotinamide-nucleotide adenylyltransferase/ribosylnicotinamide kinase NadR [Candidatus Dojkabacteria bacterium]
MSRVGFIAGKFLPFHQGHAYAIVSAYTQCDELYIILTSSEKLEKELCEGGRMRYIPWNIRLRWLRQFTKNMPNVHILVEHDGCKKQEEYDWGNGLRKTKKLIGKEVNVIFSSEPSYTPHFKKIFPKAEHIIIDPKRTRYSISGTQIRKDGIYKHWDYIPQVARPYFCKKVVIIGTESCGKSTLVKNLAKVYNTEFVEEYGRTMCEWAGGEDEVLTPDLYPFIAYKHKAEEFDKIQKANKVLFIDTEALVTKYYLTLYSSLEDTLYNSIAKHQNYDLILFSTPDVPWINDGTRRHGKEQIRKENNEAMKKIFDDAEVKYEVLEGNYNQKLKKAITLVDRLLS